MNSASLPLRLKTLQQEFREELISIADWWVANAQDGGHGGFYGEIGENNVPVTNASKGVILNARILWFFSEAALVVEDPAYRRCAQRAYEYLQQFFFDKEHEGVFWELDCTGKPLNTKKQVYAQAFTIYALCAYYQLTQDKEALARALECFHLIEHHARDKSHEGYLEAFTRNWGVLDDLRLSEKDLNFPKSQNTHLHILEAYTSLHLIHPSPEVKAALRYNIELFDKFMIDKNTFHLRMFMDLEWKDFSPGYTFGHDIEASWLIAKALDSLGDEPYRAMLTPTLINIAGVTLDEGIGAQGQVLDSYDFASKKINADSVWWVQAEAVVGFLYACVASGDEKYFLAAEKVWSFIKEHQMDREHGEWLWLSALDDPRDEPYYKVGFWKCPYHNGRAMIEASRYLEQLKQ
jgi:mannobiose 2-epimerase